MDGRLELLELLVDESLLGVGPMVLFGSEALCGLLVQPMVGGVNQQAVVPGHEYPVTHRRGVAPGSPCLLHLFFGDQRDRRAGTAGDAPKQIADSGFENVIHRLAELLTLGIFLGAEVEERLPVQLRSAEPIQYPGGPQRDVGVIVEPQQWPFGEGVPTVCQHPPSAFLRKSFPIFADGVRRGVAHEPERGIVHRFLDLSDGELHLPGFGVVPQPHTQCDQRRQPNARSRQKGGLRDATDQIVRSPVRPFLEPGVVGIREDEVGDRDGV